MTQAQLEVIFLVIWAISGLATAFRVAKPLNYEVYAGEMPTAIAIIAFAFTLAGGCISAIVYLLCVPIK